MCLVLLMPKSQLRSSGPQPARQGRISQWMVEEGISKGSMMSRGLLYTMNEVKKVKGVLDEYARAEEASIEVDLLGALF